MKIRDLLIILLALAVSVGLALGTRYLLQGGGEGKGVKMAKVLVATSDLPVGTRLTESSFTWKEWPVESIQQSYITENQKEQVSKLVGALVRDRVNSGEPIIFADLAMENGGILSAVVEEGMRAYTIPVDRRSSVSGQILPGDWVDVIVAYRDGSSRTYTSRTVVRKVKVLEVNSELDADEANEASGDKSKIKSITVQVSANQAEALAAGLREGSPVISLHSLVAGGDDTDYKEAKKEATGTVTIIRGEEVQELKINNN